MFVRSFDRSFVRLFVVSLIQFIKNHFNTLAQLNRNMSYYLLLFLCTDCCVLHKELATITFFVLYGKCVFENIMFVKQHRVEFELLEVQETQLFLGGLFLFFFVIWCIKIVKLFWRYFYLFLLIFSLLFLFFFYNFWNCMHVHMYACLYVHRNCVFIYILACM